MNFISYKELIVWEKSMKIVESIYKLTEALPKAETYGLTSQIRRSAVSIPSNIAEGSMRGTRKDYRSFLVIARGSAAELRTQIEITFRLKYLNQDLYSKIDDEIEQIIKILNTMTRKLKESNNLIN